MTVKPQGSECRSTLLFDPTEQLLVNVVLTLRCIKYNACFSAQGEGHSRMAPLANRMFVVSGFL